MIADIGIPQIFRFRQILHGRIGAAKFIIFPQNRLRSASAQGGGEFIQISLEDILRLMDNGGILWLLYDSGGKCGHILQGFLLILSQIGAVQIGTGQIHEPAELHPHEIRLFRHVVQIEMKPFRLRQPVCGISDPIQRVINILECFHNIL